MAFLEENFNKGTANTFSSLAVSPSTSIIAQPQGLTRLKKKMVNKTMEQEDGAESLLHS